MSGKNKKARQSVSGGLSQIEQDYDLQHALSLIRRGGKNIVEPSENTKTDIRIGSVIVNIPDNSEANYETQSRLTSNYATEQYVESLVNDLKADQKISNIELTESFNEKINVINNRIDIIKDKCLSKEGFWTGISIVLALLGFFLYDMHEPKQKIEGLKETVEQQVDRIEKIEENVKSMNDSISLIKKDVRNLQKSKK